MINFTEDELRPKSPYRLAVLATSHAMQGKVMYRNQRPPSCSTEEGDRKVVALVAKYTIPSAALLPVDSI